MRPGARFLLLLVLAGSGCTSLVQGLDEVPPTVLPDPVYEELFPSYVELCARSASSARSRRAWGASRATR